MKDNLRKAVQILQGSAVSAHHIEIADARNAARTDMPVRQAQKCFSKRRFPRSRLSDKSKRLACPKRKRDVLYCFKGLFAREKASGAFVRNAKVLKR